MRVNIVLLIQMAIGLHTTFLFMFVKTLRKAKVIILQSIFVYTRFSNIALETLGGNHEIDIYNTNEKHPKPLIRSVYFFIKKLSLKISQL